MASIIAVGNPGAAKSTKNMAEALRRAGLTLQTDGNGTRFFDYPGLADSYRREKIGQAITRELQKGGEYKIIFFLRTESGRAVAEDITTLKLVLDSAPEIGDQYGIVIHKVSSMLSKKLMDKEHPEHAKAFLTEVFDNIDPKRRCNESSITFLPDEENDKLIPVNDLETIDGIPFKDYVTEYLINAKLTQGEANPIAIHNFEKQTEEIEHEMQRNRQREEEKQKEKEKQKKTKKVLLVSLIIAIIAIGIYIPTTALRPQTGYLLPKAHITFWRQFPTVSNQ